MNREIPIIADDILANPEFGTGAVKVTPWRDPMIRGRAAQQSSANRNNERCRAVNENARPYKGLGRFEARQRVLEDLERRSSRRRKRYVVPGKVPAIQLDSSSHR